MTIYIAYCHDRHSDPELFGFFREDDAIKRARQYMNDTVAHPERLIEETVEGIFHIFYGEEEDEAFVMAVEVN